MLLKCEYCFSTELQFLTILFIILQSESVKCLPHLYESHFINGLGIKVETIGGTLFDLPCIRLYLQVIFPTFCKIVLKLIWGTLQQHLIVSLLYCCHCYCFCFFVLSLSDFNTGEISRTVVSVCIHDVFCKNVQCSQLYV